VQASEYLSGACFGRGGFADTQLSPLTNSAALSRQFTPLKPVALNPPTVRPPAPPVASVSQRKVIELEPVSLLSQPVKTLSKVHSEDNDAHLYWTANW
jgi:hypothetical protein